MQSKSKPWAVVTQKVMTGSDGKDYEMAMLDVDSVPNPRKKGDSQHTNEVADHGSKQAMSGATLAVRSSTLPMDCIIIIVSSDKV